MATSSVISTDLCVHRHQNYPAASRTFSIQMQSLAVRCVNENRKKLKRFRWQAANHGCHCFDRAFLLAGACVCCVKFAFLAVFVYATHATQAIAFEWKPGLTLGVRDGRNCSNEWLLCIILQSVNNNIKFIISTFFQSTSFFCPLWLIAETPFHNIVVIVLIKNDWFIEW